MQIKTLNVKGQGRCVFAVKKSKSVDQENVWRTTCNASKIC